MNLKKYAVSVALLLAGCQSPLGDYDKNISSRALWQRVERRHYEKITELENTSEIKLEDYSKSQFEIQRFARYRFNDGREREEEGITSKSEVIVYFLKEGVRFVKKNFEEDNGFRQTLEGGERIYEDSKKTLEGIEDWLITPLGIENADLSLTIKTEEFGFKITIPFGEEEIDNSFRKARRKYEQIIEQEQSVTASNIQVSEIQTSETKPID